jgi:hypothetical protein
LNPNNTEQIGSDMGGGASGGGWFQNFGQYAVGEPGVGLNTAPNTLRSVTSWGFTAPQPMIFGGSVLDSRYFGAGGILTIICAHKVGNCN